MRAGGVVLLTVGCGHEDWGHGLADGGNGLADLGKGRGVPMPAHFGLERFTWGHGVLEALRLALAHHGCVRDLVLPGF